MRIAKFLDHDILLSATLAEPPAKIGRFAHDRLEFADFEAYRVGPEGVFAYSPFTAIFNAINKVSMSLELLGISRAVYDEDDGSGDEGPADRSKQHPDKAEKRRPPSEDGE